MSNKAIFIILSLLGMAGVSYFGFITEYKDGLSWFNYISSPFDLGKIDRLKAIQIIEEATKGKMTGIYGDDYLIARAKAFLLKQDYFYLDNKKRKFITATGKETSI